MPTLLLDTFTAADGTDPTSRDMDVYPSQARWAAQGAQPAGSIVGNAWRATPTAYLLYEFPSPVALAQPLTLLIEGPVDHYQASVNSYDANGGEAKIILQRDSAGQYVGVIVNAASPGGTISVYSSTYPVAAGTTVKAAAHFDGSRARVYVNGVLAIDESFGYTFPNLDYVLLEQLLGGNAPPGTIRSMDMVGTYYGLTTAEASALTTASPPPPPPPPIPPAPPPAGGEQEPAGLCPWEVVQTRALRPMHDPVPRVIGEPRHRRTLRSAPSEVALRRYLTAAEASLWWAWWQGDAQMGAAPFDALLAHLGGGIGNVMLHALEQPRCEAMPGGVWMVELRAVTAALGAEASAGAGGGSGPPPTSVTGDEWRVYGATGLGDFAGPFSAPGPDRIWPATLSGGVTPSDTPAILYLQRRTVTRTAPPITNTITADVVNTSTTPPPLNWSPTASDPAPILVLHDAPNGIWALRVDTIDSGPQLAFGPSGVLTVGGSGLQTIISRSPASLYLPIAWEYAWS